MFETEYIKKHVHEQKMNKIFVNWLIIQVIYQTDKSKLFFFGSSFWKVRICCFTFDMKMMMQWISLGSWVRSWNFLQEEPESKCISCCLKRPLMSLWSNNKTLLIDCLITVTYKHFRDRVHCIFTSTVLLTSMLLLKAQKGFWVHQ